MRGFIAWSEGQRRNHERDRTNSSNAPRTCAMTPPHDRVLSCRNSRALGYQGESPRSKNHRQSELYGNKIHTGFPIAPARWATLVSTEITKSKRSTIAAVSEKSVSSSLRDTT